jgi:hypothetical protein
MRPSALLLRTALIALLAALTSAPLHAQIVEVGAFATLGRTGVRELGNPRGFGLSVTWPLGDIAGFRLEGNRTSSSPRWTATCEVPLSDDCQEETVENEVRGMQVAALLVTAPFRHSGWRVEGIVGVTRLQFSHEVAGVESGRLLPQSSDKEAAFSTSFGAAVVHEGLGTDRLRARLEWRHARMRGNITSCPADACPIQWDDFGVDELRLGAAWRF